MYCFVIEDIRANRMIRYNEIPQLVALEMQLEWSHVRSPHAITGHAFLSASLLSVCLIIHHQLLLSPLISLLSSLSFNHQLLLNLYVTLFISIYNSKACLSFAPLLRSLPFLTLLQLSLDSLTNISANYHRYIILVVVVGFF